jgi:uncharacterized membrane protein required for colicin V production
MTILILLLLLLVLAACEAFLSNEGIWSNAIRLVNVITAALLATNFWEPLARLLEENVSKSLSYFWDFVALWGLFCVFLVIFRVLTRFASDVQVKFMGIVDRTGGAILAFCVGWVMICFTLMTLHTAPLKPEFLFGSFQPNEAMFLGMSPDKQWLSFVEGRSAGSFSRSQPRVFDPGHNFIRKYEERRETLHAHIKTSSKGPRDVLVPAGNVPAR